MRDLHQRCHLRLQQVLHEGDIAVDATLGNGYDTCCLAEAVGQSGRVYGFDLQFQAIESTRTRLEESGLSDRVELIHSSHSNWNVLPDQLKGTVRAVTFNLGYLPGGDHELTTMSATTLEALNSAMRWLASDGVISVMIYHGHPAGQDEKESLLRFFEDLPPSGWNVEDASVDHPGAPNLFFINRL